MTATTRTTDDDAPQPNPPVVDDGADEQRESLVQAAGAGEECVVCSSGLAADQRYCVECGTRRGKPRFTLATANAVEPEPSRGRRTERAGLSTATVLVGIVTLLLALGVGVLIGKSVAATPKATNVHVYVNDVGGGSSRAGGGSSGTANSTSGGSTTSGASKKTTGTNGNSATSCTAGTPGCKAGKQTGTFFGG